MVVKINDIKKKFSDQPVLRGVSFDAEEGDLVALIGPSGCGKSTLLRCINGLESIDAGQVQVNGTTLVDPRGIGDKEFHQRAQAVRKKVGMVFQSFNLFPHLTLLENVSIAQVVVQKKSRAEAEDLAHSLLNKVGLREHEDKYPTEVSGGQQQRAAIARALALNPKVLLYDEPTSALDPGLSAFGQFSQGLARFCACLAFLRFAPF